MDTWAHSFSLFQNTPLYLKLNSLNYVCFPYIMKVNLLVENVEIFGINLIRDRQGVKFEVIKEAAVASW